MLSLLPHKNIITAPILGSILLLANAANAFTGNATWYDVQGLGLPGSCGQFKQNSDFVVALSIAEAANNAHCGQNIIVSFQGKSTQVTVFDTCVTCGGQFDIDLSPGVFEFFAPLSKGLIQVEWEFA